jgi:hypothetical protein
MKFKISNNEMKNDGTLPSELSFWYKSIIIRCFREHNQIILQFIDNGGGIPQPISNKILSRFLQQKK